MKEYLFPHKPLLSGVIVCDAVVIVVDTGAAHIGGSGYGGATCTTGDDFGFKMVYGNRQSLPFLCNDCKSAILAVFHRKVKMAVLSRQSKFAVSVRSTETEPRRAHDCRRQYTSRHALLCNAVGGE